MNKSHRPIAEAILIIDCSWRIFPHYLPLFFSSPFIPMNYFSYALHLFCFSWVIVKICLFRFFNDGYSPEETKSRIKAIEQKKYDDRKEENRRTKYRWKAMAVDWPGKWSINISLCTCVYSGREPSFSKECGRFVTIAILYVCTGLWFMRLLSNQP